MQPAEDTPQQSSSFFDVEELRAKLKEAREQGLKRARRIQRPTLLLGLLILLFCMISGFAGLAGDYFLTITISFSAFASYVLFLSVTAMQPRTVWCTAVIMIVVIMFPIVYFFLNNARTYVALLRNGCTYAANPAVTCALWMTLFVVRALVAAVNALLLLYLGWNLRPGVTAARRLEVIWRAYGIAFTGLGLAAVFATFAGLHSSGGGLVGLEASVEPSGFAMLLFGLLGLSRQVRTRVHAWLSSIGGDVSAAVSISSAMFMEAGLRSSEDMLIRAQAMLRSVSGADVTLRAFSGAESSAPSMPARLGEIDAFVSCVPSAN